MTRYIRWFDKIGSADASLVGGKTASLDELYSALASQGIAVPNGFAITADAYRAALSREGAADALHQLVHGQLPAAGGMGRFDNRVSRRFFLPWTSSIDLLKTNQCGYAVDCHEPKGAASGR